MGRPRAVLFNKFKNYTKLHTKMEKMYSGVYFNVLYPIKETAQYFVSCEVWASCASKFKIKKKNIEKLEVNIPILTSEKSIKFLEDNCWGHRELEGNSIEAADFLKKLYPNHTFKFFYELSQIFSDYNHGTFVSYDDEGNVEKPSEHHLETRAHLTQKYNKFQTVKKDSEFFQPEIKELYDKYSNYTKENKGKAYDEDVSSQLFDKFYDREREYVFENFDLTNTFIDISKHGVCLPMAFKEGTADWHKEKYGTVCSYAHAGETFFVVTEDSVYLEVKRHY